MIDIHSKYNNMHKSRMFYALIYINNHIISSIIRMTSRAKISEHNDHLLEAFQKFIIDIPLINAVKDIPSYTKFFKGICKSHRSPKRIHFSETMSSIMMNTLSIKKRDLRAPMITSELRGMTFIRFLVDTRTSINLWILCGLQANHTFIFCLYSLK